jgi:hypothetical protein
MIGQTRVLKTKAECMKKGSEGGGCRVFVGAHMAVGGMRVVLLVMLVLFAVLSPSGCSKKQAAQVEDIADVTERMEAILDFSVKGMYDVPKEFMLELLKVDDGMFTDFVMKIPTGTNQNEYGVFIAAEGREKEAEESVAAYLKARKEDWDRQYLAEEGIKIDQGQCGREGPYVYFVIGSDNFKEVSGLFEGLAWE